MVGSEELPGTTEYLTLYTRFHINRCRYNGVRIYLREFSLTSVIRVLGNVLCSNDYLIIISMQLFMQC
jgi:hypothetical protein